MRKIRVGIIFGGRSGEHEVSVISAASVISALDKVTYEAVPIYINKKGQWLLGVQPKSIKGKGAEYVYLPPDPTAKGLVPIKTAKEFPKKVDVIFPVLHGPFGEDGAVQGLLELAGIPYVGAGVAASAVGMDKALMKKFFEATGLPVTKYLVFLRKEVESGIEKVIATAEKELDYPVFVKPANLGSSVGITKAHNRKELKEGFNIACEYDRKVVVEQGIDKAREIEVAVVGNDEPEASICGEVVPSREFYDYEDKYILNKAKLLIPAQISKQQSEKIRSMAVQAFKATDCAGMARADFFIDRKTNQVFIDEVNTIPGFTSISMYPKLWQASGIGYSDLISRLINLALDRYNDKGRNKVSFPSKLLK
ncbi:MAG: D-alanine--D-alanine ligase A [Candidatus Woykebacteria bacterium GWB1_45_5]|uniref:D-alanine--D-alanine ligase n=1 Tax=Candidatus Woykebacteria bacterium GWB1_45_5 TaxID=1802592 RepID=A0A1G1W5X0_9BACT|nr:MAG: D-alanine--D-alanine ligase A [Candidatus Woykebacteria bacterium GWB1_45_5]